MRFTNRLLKIAVSITALGLVFIPIKVIAGDTFKIEIEREESRSWHRYNFPGNVYNIQATSDDIEVRVCRGAINEPECTTTTIRTYPITIRLGGVVHIIVPEGKGKVRISIWE